MIRVDVRSQENEMGLRIVSTTSKQRVESLNGDRLGVGLSLLGNKVIDTDCNIALLFVLQLACSFAPKEVSSSCCSEGRVHLRHVGHGYTC